MKDFIGISGIRQISVFVLGATIKAINVVEIFAFQDFSIKDGVLGSEFVGFKNIILFINNPILKNTLILGL